MIDYVDRLLAHWAQEISVNTTSHGLGVRSAWAVDIYEGGATTRQLTAHGVASRVVKGRGGIGRVADRVDRAVGNLMPHLEQVVRVQYLESPGLTIPEKAEIIGCSVRSFHNYIHRAHVAISEDLPDSYAGWSPNYPQPGPRV